MKYLNHTLDKLVNNSFNFLWVKRNALKWSEIVTPANFLDMTKSIQHASAFQVVWLLNLRMSIKFLQKKLDFHKTVFIDLGCGTGISTLYASQWSFSHLIGIDFQEDLISKAQENLSRWPDSTRIKFVVGDASDWIIPSFSGTVILFLFNPFAEPVFRDFLGRNLETLRNNCFIILINDKLRETVLENYESEIVYRDTSRQISIISL